MNNPLISIIVPCYNQAQYLSEALQSVLEQTYENWECIIVNDGSPDDTAEVADTWVEKDDRFIYLFKENGGLSIARNFGIEHAKGEFILPLDADDKISKAYVRDAIAAFQYDASLKLVYCKAEKFGNEVGPWILPIYSLFTLARFNCIFCSAVFRKSEWEKVGGYDLKMIYGLEDWEFWIAILKDGGNVKCLESVGFYYRVKAGSMAKTMNEEERLLSEHYVSNKHIDFILKNYEALHHANRKILSQLTSKKFLLNRFTRISFGFTLFNLKR